MLRFCVNAGPAFIISAVGAGMMGSVRMGAVLFAAHILASLLLGIGGRIWDGRSRKNEPEERSVLRTKRLPGQQRLPFTAVYVRLRGAVCRHSGVV